jgi:GPH family glycoside/pentoside/hexuronide:cation symporter
MSDKTMTVGEPLEAGSSGRSGKLSVREKLAYGVGSANDAWGNWFLVGAVWPVFNEYLGVAPSLVSLALMLNRLFDAFSDPLFGWASDNYRSRWGRRRPFILVGSVLSGLAMIAFFQFVQPGWGSEAGAAGNPYFWYMVVMSGILITCVSCFNMPYQSLGAEMTPDYEERTSVFAYRGGIQKVAEIANFGAAAFFTLAIFDNILQGAKVAGWILGLVMMAVGVAVFAGTRERYYESKVSTGKKIRIVEAFLGALRCKPFRTQLAMAFSYGTSTSLVGTLGLYTTVFYVCGGDWASGGKWNLAMGASMVLLGFAGIPFFANVAHRTSKRTAMIVVILMSILAFGATWVLYNPAHPWLQLLASGFNAFTMAGFWMLYGAIGADVIDYDELESGKRREGAFSACGSLFVKIGLAVGIGVSGFLLDGIGFDEKLGGNQSAETLTAMRLFLAGIPIVGLVVALAFILRFQLTRERSAEIRRELEARRGTVA